MALRVLLADESTTIKKVMQLALQDFAVEVKAVHVGVDVVEVARAFKPDIIFADVLLQKKNGYEVTSDLKQDPTLSATPVVLMWSSFMDLDEKLAASSGADRRLEKPFDVENLRKLILDLVPSTRSQRLATFLEFPTKVTEPLKAEEAAKRSTAKPVSTPAPVPEPLKPAPSPAPPPTPVAAPTPPEEAPPSSKWNMDSFEDIEDFAVQTAETTKIGAVPLPAGLDDEADEDDEQFKEFNLRSNEPKEPVKVPQQKPQAEQKPQPQQKPQPPSLAASADEDESWSHQDLSRFKIDLQPFSIETEDGPMRIDLDDENPLGVVTPPHTHAEEPAFILEEDAGLAQPISPDEAGDAPLAPVAMLEFSSNEDTSGLTIEGVNVEAPAGQEISLTMGETSNLDREILPPLEGGSVPQLSPDRLEEIIRAQSREIIESVVRRIVPDLASDIIRQELQRLLEDTAVRDSESRR